MTDASGGPIRNKVKAQVTHKILPGVAFDQSHLDTWSVTVSEVAFLSFFVNQFL